MPTDIGGTPAGVTPLDIAREEEEATQAATLLDTDTAAREKIIGAPSPDMSAFDTATTVRAAFSLHFAQQLPGVEWGASIDPLADRFLEMFGSDPGMVAAMQDDLSTVLALTDDQIAARISAGESMQSLETTDLFDAITEVAWEVGADELAARLNAQAVDAVRGTFEALTSVEAFQATGVDLSEVRGRTMLETAESHQIASLFDVPAAWSYSPGVNALTVTVGDESIQVSPEPGFSPDSTLDVVAAVVKAQAEGKVIAGSLTPGHKPGAVDRIIQVAHDVGGWLEENPELRQGIDDLWNMATRFSLYNVVENVQGRGTPLLPGQPGAEQGPMARAAAELKNEKGEITAEAIRQASIIPLPESEIIAALADRFIAEVGADLSNKDALAFAAEAVDENRKELEDSVRSLTSEQLVADLEADIEGQTPLGRSIEKGLNTALDVMSGYDAFTQWIGVTAVDFQSDFLRGIYEVATGDFEQGFQLWKDMWTERPDDPTVGDFFDLEGAWYDGVNIVSSIVFDPLNWVTAGGKGASMIARRALTNPKFAPIYLKMGRFPKYAELIATAGRRVETAAAGELAQSGAIGAGAVKYAGRAVDTQQMKAVRVVGSMVGPGMDDTEFFDLLNIALDPEGTVDQVNEVWTRALKKDWLPDATFGPAGQKSILGIGTMLESAAAGALGPEQMDTVLKMVAKLSSGRTMRLGENQAFSALNDLLIQFYPADKDAYTTSLIRVANALRAEGDNLAFAGAEAMTKEQARRALMETGGTLKAIEKTDDIIGMNQNLRSVDDSLAHLPKTAFNEGWDETTTASVRDQLTQMRNTMAARVEDARPKVVKAREKRQYAQKQLAKATRLKADNMANAARNAASREVFQIYEDMAVRLNKKFGEVIPVMKGKINPVAPDIKPRDWSAVTGARKTLAEGDPDLGILMGLAGDDMDLAAQARAVGMTGRSQHIALPASPYEVLLFEKLGGPGQQMENALRMIRSQFVKKWMSKLRIVFGLNLLANPLTAGKVTLDETLRFLAETGDIAGFAKATGAGLPGVGKVFEGTWNKIAARGGEAISNPWAIPYRRNVAGWSADDYQEFGWVDRPGRRSPHAAQYREQVERWVNGTLLNDRRFQAYARWVDSAEVLDDGTLIPPPDFVEWWDVGDEVARPGKADVKPVRLTIRDQANLTGADITAADAFNIIDNVWRNWLDNMVDPAQRDALRDAMLRAARTPGGRIDLKAQAHLLNAVQRVPGLSPNTGFGSGVFQMFFGGPSGRRAGVFFEHYFDEGYNILLKRHGDRVLTVDRLMELAGVDKGTAEVWLKQGTENRVVAKLIQDTGARTEGQLAARAAAWAERKSDDLMYRFTASSMVGRGVESGMVIPFARAQADFLSWWWDHLTKPMTLRLSPEMRMTLAERTPTLMAGLNKFENMPINLRALAKYSHYVAAVNNETPSWLDQTIDSLTFFPLRYDSGILLDLVPQFGPLPSWLFDHMADMGLLPDEAVTNVETVFPALSYTEADPDPWMDLMNRWLPNSRRSLRDWGVGTARLAYTLFGKDIHTEPGAGGIIANILADNKVPASTGDFQTAGVAELFTATEDSSIWDLVPGSEEWDRAINQVAIRGAVEANQAEWVQDVKDRVFPVNNYNAEYRSLVAYEPIFSEEVYSQMVEFGLFETNDLLTNDEGVSRIRQAWDKYQDHTATQDDLRYLDDALTTAYFKAGEVEIVPGFSYLDYLNLEAPQITVNLIAKNEDSGIPVRDTVARQVGGERLTHAEFKQRYLNKLTGRLINVPPGPEGAEVVKDARDYGWLVSRPLEEWAQDAAEAVYKSGQRAVHGVWERVSYRTWAAGLTQAITDKTFTLDETSALILGKAGMTVEAGTTYTYGEFFELLDDFDERFDVAQPVLMDTLERGAVHGRLAVHDDIYGLGLLDDLHAADLAFGRAGIESVEDWPDVTLTAIRARFAGAIDLGYITEDEYAQEMAPLFGPIDYEPPTPPPVDELETGFTVDDMADVQVIDGDTITVLLDDGPMRVRIIGINAPEVTQPGYAEARASLDAVIANATNITVGVFKPELFGLTQLSGPTEKRLLAWLYVDGIPLYDPTVFSASNPRGAGVGGKVLDLEALLEARR